MIITAASFIFIFLGFIIRNLRSAHVLFYNWDESLYAQTAWEMLKNKSPILTFNGHVWLDKPPLLQSLLAVIFTIFGRSEFWARFLMVIFSSVLIVLLYFLSKRIINRLFPKRIKAFGNLEKEIIFLLPVFFLSSSNIFINHATLVNTDIMIAISWVGYFLFQENFYLKYLFLIFGVLSKSVFGYYPLLFDVFSIKKSSLTVKNFKKNSLMLLLSFSWYISGIVTFGNYFVKAHFLDQVLKRVVVPIELHFGGKFYYFEYLWNNFGILNFILVAGFIILFFDLVGNFKNWRKYLILLSPLPFFIFLTLAKTKLYWYLEILIPLLSLISSYLYVKINNKILRALLFIGVFIFFLFKFIPQTYTTASTYTPPNELKIAQCLSKQQGTSLAFLTNIQERKNRNFLEASHYDTTASFYYGGSPAFVFYSKKKIQFFYDPSDFMKKYENYDIVVISNEDEALLQKLKKDARSLCQTKTWFAFGK